jgi:hypothetical protein
MYIIFPNIDQAKGLNSLDSRTPIEYQKPKPNIKDINTFVVNFSNFIFLGLYRNIGVFINKVNIMSKIVRLTESDLKRIIQMVSLEMKKNLTESVEPKSRIIYKDAYGSVEETDFVVSDLLSEAEYKGRKVQLGKIMQGDVKKFKVYVKNDKGNVVKVNFGFGGSSAKGKRMVIKKNNPARRKSFRARHNCDNPGPRWKARYWACRTW